MDTKLIRSVIVDDEPNSQMIIKKLLEKYIPEVQVIGTADSVESAVKVISEKKPDLVFLDISMPDGDGFEVLEKIKDKDFKVVFITAYDNYAIRAFEVSALHYLLKPVKVEDLQDAVNRYKEELKSSERADLNTQLEILKGVLNRERDLKRLILSTSSGMHVIDIDDIIRCESSNNYTTFYFTNGKRIIVSKSIQMYEKMLEPYHFCRIHNKHIVNLKYIKKFVKGRGGYVELTNGEQIDVSESRKKILMNKLRQYAIGL